MHMDDAAARAAWPLPAAGDDKYARGVVGVVAGSDTFPGAAVLTCSGAVRTGAGYTRLLGPRRVQDLVLDARPEVTCAEFAAELPRASAWVVGPGVAVEATIQREAVAAVLAAGLPMCVDAGALTDFCSALLGGAVAAPSQALLTPHAGELARVRSALGLPAAQGDLATDAAARSAAALEVAIATGAAVLLKGYVTVIASPNGEVTEVSEAPAWLATAGAGDVLAGVCGALLAQGLAPAQAAALAAFVHGRAAARAAGPGTGMPIAALDVAEALPEAIGAIVSAP